VSAVPPALEAVQPQIRQAFQIGRWAMSLAEARTAALCESRETARSRV